jgi:DNA-binding winged helix-turn-helix (wHTH) protein/Tol biopolymer transport system component
MTEEEPQVRPVTFGNFEVDLRSGELRKAGNKLKLSGQPFQVLVILLERPGEVVTREELQKRLWPDTFVDVEHNLNTSINKIREALGDSAESPRFVETVPRRGYRFIAPVDGGVIAPGPVVETPPATKSKVWGKPLYYGLALLGVVIVVGVLALRKPVARTPGAPRVVRFIKLTNDGQVKSGPLATDGSRIYFNEKLANGRSLIAQVSVAGGEVVPLLVPLTQPEVRDVSKEGTELLVANNEGSESNNSLWLQPVAGGSPRRVGTVLANYANFSADGTRIIYGNKHDVYSVSRDGSSIRKLLRVDGIPFGFRFSPDTRFFRFTEFDAQNDTATIMEANADGTGLRRMFPGFLGEWTPGGRFYIFRNTVDGRSDLWVSRIEKSFRGQEREDKPTQLTTGPLDFQLSLPSKDGKGIFAIGNSRQAEVIRYDSRSREFVPYLNGISAEGLAFSLDGQWVAYTSYPDGMLWRSKLDGTERLQLTFPPMKVVMPRWSPDGKQIAFNAIVPGVPWNIYVISSAGGTAQRVLPSDQGQIDADWSPDGNSLVFGSVPFTPNTPISIIDLRSRRVSILPGSNGFFSPHWSPDGRYMSATVTETEKLMLFDFSTQKWTQVSDSEAGAWVGYPIWSRDGKYLYFQDYPAQDANYRIVRLRLSDRRIENVAELSNVGRLTVGTFTQWFGIAPDNSPLFARDISTQEIYTLEMEWP